MAYQSLYRRYRPQRFGEIVGQEHVVSALRGAVRAGRVGHAYLFSGPRGTGKTSTARILAKALNCPNVDDGEPCGTCEVCQAIAAGSSLDVFELDAASNNGVDEVRDLVARAALGTPGRTKLYILDEVHMLSKAASNALLKTLEEPPAHVVFVLATTDPQKVLPTIRSRTQQFSFGLVPPDRMAAHLRWVADDAGLEVDGDAVDHVVRVAGGSVRDALSALDQVVAAGGAAPSGSSAEDLVEALAERDAGRVLTAVAQASAAGRDARSLADALVERLREGFLALMAPELVSVPAEDLPRLADQARRLGTPALVRALELLGEVLVELRHAPDPRVLVEVTLVRLARPELDTSPAGLAERVARLEAGVARGGAPAGGAEPAVGPADRPAPPGPAPGVRPAPAGPPRAERAGGRGGAARPEPSPADGTPGDGAAGTGSGDAPVGPGPQATADAVGRTRPALGAVRSTARSGSRPAPKAPPPGPAGREPRNAPGPPGTAASPPPDAAPAVTPPGSGGPELPFPDRDQLTLAWGDTVLAGLRPGVKARFGAGRFLGVDDGVALFAVPNATHRERCEPLRGEVEAALAAHFGRPVPLRLVLDDDPGGGGPGAARPGGGGSGGARRRVPGGGPGRGGPSPARGDEPPPPPPPEDGYADDELAIDLDDLVDAPASAAPRSVLELVQRRFPGAELVAHT